jgi:hypothetical protein
VRQALIAGIAIAVLAMTAAEASATTFYAAPNGNGPSPCSKSDPCSLLDATDFAGDGDEVIALPGVHNLGSDLVELNFDIDLHGVPGAETIVRSSGVGAINVVQGDARVADLRIEGPGEPLFTGFGGHPTFERVRVFGSSPNGTCVAPVAPGLIRDSLCVNSGGGPALTFNGGSGGAFTANFEIVNVTAASPADGPGIRFIASGGLTESVTATNTIARGGGSTADVRTNNFGTGTISVALDHSNYNATDAGAGATITPAGSGSNQTAAPLFADAGALDFHQLADSPTVDAGATVSDLGPLDFDRQPRIQDGEPDIGADEFDDRLKLKVKAKKKQKAKTLKVKVWCPEEECYVTARGSAKVGEERFKLKKTKRRFLEAGERKKLRLKAKNLDELKQLLAGGVEGEAKVKLKGTDAGGVRAKKKVKLKLVG